MTKTVCNLSNCGSTLWSIKCFLLRVRMMSCFICCQFMSMSCQSLSIIHVLCQFMSILCQFMSMLCQICVNNLKHVILSIHVNLCQLCQLIIDKTFYVNLCQSLSIRANLCQCNPYATFIIFFPNQYSYIYRIITYINSSSIHIKYFSNVEH